MARVLILIGTESDKFSVVLKVIEFEEKFSNKYIIEATNYFKSTSNVTTKIPQMFLDEGERVAVLDSGKFRVSKRE